MTLLLVNDWNGGGGRPTNELAKPQSELCSVCIQIQGGPEPGGVGGPCCHESSSDANTRINQLVNLFVIKSSTH